VVVKFFTEVMISSRCMNSGRCGLEVPVCNPVTSLILFTEITTLLSVVFMALFFPYLQDLICYYYIFAPNYILMFVVSHSLIKDTGCYLGDQSFFPAKTCVSHY